MMASTGYKEHFSAEPVAKVETKDKVRYPTLTIYGNSPAFKVLSKAKKGEKVHLEIKGSVSVLAQSTTADPYATRVEIEIHDLKKDCPSCSENPYNKQG